MRAYFFNNDYSNAQELTLTPDTENIYMVRSIILTNGSIALVNYRLVSNTNSKP